MSTAGPGRPASTTDSGDLQNSLEPGQSPRWPRTLRPEAWGCVLLGEALMEVTTRDLSLAHKHLKRIQTLRHMVWLGGYSKIPRGRVVPGPVLCGRSRSGRERQWPSEDPLPILALGFLLVKMLDL